MDSVKVKALLKSVELGSLTKAAEELGYTQAGLTHMMNRLETEMGIKVLNRDKNGVSLTPQGARLKRYFEEFNIAGEHLEKNINEIAEGSGEVIRVGAYTSILKTWLPDIINGFKKKNPTVRFQIRDSSTEDNYNLVRISELDVAFGSQRDGLGCRFVSLFKDRFYAVLPEIEKRFDNSDTIPITYFNGVDFLTPTYGYDSDVLAALSSHNIKPIFNDSTVGDDSVTSLVKIGMGVSILPELVLRSVDHSGIKYKRLEPECYRELGLIVPEGKINSPLVRDFVKFSEQYLKR